MSYCVSPVGHAVHLIDFGAASLTSSTEATRIHIEWCQDGPEEDAWTNEGGSPGGGLVLTP